MVYSHQMWVLALLAFRRFEAVPLELPNGDGVSFCKDKEMCMILNSNNLSSLAPLISEYPTIAFASNSNLGDILSISYLNGTVLHESSSVADSFVACSDLVVASSGVKKGGENLLSFILKSKDSHFLAISDNVTDFCERSPTGRVVICLDNESVSHLGLNNSGRFVYHGIDRTILPVENFNSMPEQVLDDLESVDLSSKPFVAGFFIDNSDDVGATRLAYAILREIGMVSGLKEKFFIGAYVNELGLNMSSAARLDDIPSPLFAVIDTKNKSRRWAVIDEEKLNNTSYLVQLLTDIGENKIEAVPISQPEDELQHIEISHDLYWPVLNKTKTHVCVGFLGDDTIDLFTWVGMLRELDSVINATVKTFIVDVSRNDIPPYVEAPKFPYVGMYDVSRQNFSVYKGEANPKDFVKWIEETAPVKVPEDVVAKMEKRIEEDSESDDALMKLLLRILGNDDETMDGTEDILEDLKSEL